ncbi:hypothetical protein, unlikely [Trypanosoma brucei gambiense DAL972]|uniref:Uncharacterized protein n=1 Tax=Trypanosoma brucei gambiense (strain MHOM/CI/86/DAL972) TaxID=679716 RepID=C9ZLG0_TRYB9|nr:hypothetical protein, unlikely [Trypanosoma brucei gambiense DAL972]CBH10169.1 hypothetical protein, unlikely [Trypanosoma brucei gambiense DAL972]|eukprot:XP_011772459.1 hypothetical protein, unlikely [Trypanosoma brucei gambiense DAL972]
MPPFFSPHTHTHTPTLFLCYFPPFCFPYIYIYFFFFLSFTVTLDSRVNASCCCFCLLVTRDCRCARFKKFTTGPIRRGFQQSFHNALFFLFPPVVALVTMATMLTSTPQLEGVKQLRIVTEKKERGKTTKKT